MIMFKKRKRKHHHKTCSMCVNKKCIWKSDLCLYRLFLCKMYRTQERYTLDDFQVLMNFKSAWYHAHKDEHDTLHNSVTPLDHTFQNVYKARLRHDATNIAKLGAVWEPKELALWNELNFPSQISCIPSLQFLQTSKYMFPSSFPSKFLSLGLPPKLCRC